MKSIRLIALILIILSFSACMTTTSTPIQEKSLETIKEFPGLKKDELYKSVLSWAARVYNSANDVIQLKDPDSGQIICKGLGVDSFDFGFQRYFSYTLIIDIKDERVRTRFENIRSERVGNVAGPDLAYQWDGVSKHLFRLRDNLFASITQKKSDSNW